jgi:superkiller protein 3
VLRCSPDNSVYWEYLGDAYLGRGSFNSAFKSYSRAFELNDESVYAAWACGEVLK